MLSVCRLCMAFKDMAFEPGAECRHFVQVPQGATWCECTVTAGKHATPQNFNIQFSQLLPHKQPQMSLTPLSLSSEAVVGFVLPVTGGEPCELAISQLWKDNSATKLSVDLSFGGIVAQSKQVALMGSDSIYALMVWHPLWRFLGWAGGTAMIRQISSLSYFEMLIGSTTL
jgi:tripeptidyl-peptidase II